MKLFVSGFLDTVDLSFCSRSFVQTIEEADTVLILPGGLGTYCDLLFGIQQHKIIFLYNRDFYFTPIINLLFNLYQEGVEKLKPSDYLTIESDFFEIQKKLEEM